MIRGGSSRIYHIKKEKKEGLIVELSDNQSI